MAKSGSDQFDAPEFVSPKGALDASNSFVYVPVLVSAFTKMDNVKPLVVTSLNRL